MTLCDQTKITELEHTTTVLRSIRPTSENKHKKWQPYGFLKPHWNKQL